MRRPLLENSFRFAWGALRRDAARAGERFARTGGFWLVAGYRIKRLRKMNRLAWAVMFPADLALTLGRPLYAPGCQLPWQTRIGPGLTVQHAWGVVVSGRCVLGSRVTLFQGVTLGRWKGGVPKIRSDSAVFPGACVFGAVTIGRRVMIGTNAVVSRDVPSWHVAAGVPARVWSRTRAEHCGNGSITDRPDIGDPGSVLIEAKACRDQITRDDLSTGAPSSE